MKEENTEEKKSFSLSDFNTIVIKGNKGDDSNKPMDALISGLASSETKTEALKLLKSNKNGKKILLDAIEKKLNSESERALIVAACWESGIDFSDQLELFINLAITENLLVAIEAITVIENTEAKYLASLSSEIKNKLSEGSKTKKDRSTLLQALLAHIENC